MGGSAFLIVGEFDAVRAAAAAPPRSFFDRLRNRAAPAVSSTQFPNGRRLLEFPADAIQGPLARDYLTFIHGRLVAPTAASRVVLDYERLAPLSRPANMAMRNAKASSSRSTRASWNRIPIPKRC
jgi:hypothetical protein